MERKKKTTLLSRQACFVIAHSSGDFIYKNIHDHPLYTIENYITTAAENLNVQMFSCYAATLCFYDGKKIQVRYVC